MVCVNQVLSYFYLRILLYTDFSASLPTACFGVSAKFAAASLLQVSRIFLAFRASVYCRCQNPLCFNRHQDPHIPFCVALWASPSVLADWRWVSAFSAFRRSMSPRGATETSLPQYPAGSLVTASGILGGVDNPLVHRVIRYICQNSFQGACRCSTDEQSITYNNEVIEEKKVRIDLLLLGIRRID